MNKNNENKNYGNENKQQSSFYIHTKSRRISRGENYAENYAVNYEQTIWNRYVDCFSL